MNVREKINDFYRDFTDKNVKEVNLLYFESLLKKLEMNESKAELILSDGQNHSVVIPYTIADEGVKSSLFVQDYETLPKAIEENLKKINICICKMHAGLGSSVERMDMLKKYTERSSLGSKGTDLFIKYDQSMISIAEAQLRLAMDKQKYYGRVSFLNLVNDETIKAVQAIWKNQHDGLQKTYENIFSSENLRAYPEISQLKMPTIHKGAVSFERMAPGGHGFLGFYKILEIFRNEVVSDEIFMIGNGEDLKSTPDEKIISWVSEQEIPIVMITTTKLEKDKKGGQLAIVNEEIPYVTIVEKAQAEKAGQLDYFEKLGLRKGDGRSLFNTNIVLINPKALKNIFNKYLKIDEEKFREILTPDLIKNSKEQDEKIFIQLEGAIGSVLLNLDKYFRLQHQCPIVSFLNLAPENRKKFFVPIKKREDFDGIYG